MQTIHAPESAIPNLYSARRSSLVHLPSSAFRSTSLHLRPRRVMPPVLQAARGPALRILLGLLLLREVALAVGHYAPHVSDVVLVVGVRVLLGVLVQDLDDFAAAAWALLRVSGVFGSEIGLGLAAIRWTETTAIEKTLRARD